MDQIKAFKNCACFRKDRPPNQMEHILHENLFELTLKGTRMSALKR